MYRKMIVPTLVMIVVVRPIIGVTISKSGGYENLVIKLSQDLEQQQCSTAISSLKNLLEHSSPVLEKAVQDQVYFRSATVIIPSSWSSSGYCGDFPLEDGGLTPGTGADIVVSRHVSDHVPSTHQSQGCGQPGHVISLPHTFLFNTSLNISQHHHTFVHLWAKYRYGIFDQSSFTGDPLYPQTVPTVAHNEVLTVAGEVHEELDEEKSCSPNLVNTSRYCDRPGPTKHNIICDGKHVINVIKSHPDFLRSKVKTIDKSLSLRLVQETIEPRYVLVLETSGQMAASDHWTWVRKAAHKFIRYDLPVNSYLAVLSVSSTNVSLEHGLVQVDSESVRTVLADTIPGRYHLDTGHVAGTCLTCVLRTVSQIAGQHQGLDLIFVTVNHPVRNHKQRQIMDLAAKLNMRISNIVVPVETHSNNNMKFYDDLSEATHGVSYMLPSTQWNIDLLFGLNTAFSQILKNGKSNDSAEIVHTAEYFTDNLDNESEGVFVIDETLGRDSLFGIYTSDEEDHLIKSVTFEDSDGQIYGPYTKISSTLDPFNIKTINYVGEEAPFNKVAKLGKPFKYVIKWSETGSNQRKNIVIVTSKPRYDPDKTVAVQTWSSVDKKDFIVAARKQAPVKVFASVKQGNLPVLNVSVLLEVSFTEDGEHVILDPVKMVDNGDGVLDITGDDGVYSGYVPEYPGDGRYVTRIRVETTSQSSLLSRTKSPCCGSSTHPTPENLSSTTPFSRTVAGPTFHLDKTDTIPKPPISRIMDLSLTHNSTGEIILTWTGHLDQKVNYRIFFSSDIEDLIVSTSQHLQVLADLNVTTSQTLVNVSLQFPYFGREYYIAVVTVAGGSRSPMSNIVHVSQQSMVDVTGDSDNLLSDPLHLRRMTDHDWIIVGVVAGIVAVLLCLVTMMLLWLHWTRGETRALATSPPPTTVSTSVASDNSDTTEVASYDLDLIKSDLNMTREEHVPPRITPVYWSASQLLSKLEPRTSLTPTYQGVYPRPMEIPDEFCVTVSDLHFQQSGTFIKDCHLLDNQKPCGKTVSEDVRLSFKKPPPPVLPKPKNVTQV